MGMVKVNLELQMLWKNVAMKENMERSLIRRKTYRKGALSIR